MLSVAAAAATSLTSPSSAAIVPFQPQLWPTPVYWPINPDFPGLRAIHADPNIFVVEDLLSEELCEALIAKARPHMRQSLVQTAAGYAVDARRTSSDTRAEYDEVPGLQARFSDLLGMPVSHFEPLSAPLLFGRRASPGPGPGRASPGSVLSRSAVPRRRTEVSRYEAPSATAPGQLFGFHHDCVAEGMADGCDYCPTPGCNRVVTLLVYLRDCASGGATVFPNLPEPLSVRPRRGMGLIHFPATVGGQRDARVGHEGAPAVDEKWVCQQWGWSGPLVRDQLSGGIRSHGRLDEHTVL